MRILIPTLFAAVAVFTLAPPARADHGGPTATSVAEFVYQLGQVAAEFGFEPRESPAFEVPRFNRLLRRARISLDLGIRQVGRDHVCAGFFKLARGVSQLESAADFGAAQNMSGWEFADDLASLASFVAESFLEDLIALAGQEGADAGALGLAVEAELAADSLRAAGEWTAATEELAAGVYALL